VITVVERPYRPVYPNGRGLVRSVMTAGFIGLFLGIALALLRSYLKSDSARHQPVLAEFAEIRQDMRADVRRAAHALRLTRKGGEVSAG
jgi:glucose-6-phosphate-specific signal transduction histidine kinase